MAKKMTGKELVAFCRSKIGTPYVYGMKGKVMTEANFQYLYNTYGSRYVPYSDHAKVGKVCVDCSGLISWACGVVLGSGQWMNRANVKQPIASLKQAPIGALVWMDGHIGVYSGMKNGVHHYIAADGSKYGVREVPISQNRFTHWLLVESVFDYEMEEEEMVEKDTIIVDGKKHEVNMIRKDGVTYIKTRDIAELVGYQVGSQGKVPVLEKA
ncbi:MAG: hypothetical protein ACOCMZ_04085 [Acetivibrio ethanolgignens]